MKTTKHDLTRSTSKASGHEQGECAKVIAAFLKLVGEHLMDGRTVELRWFGTFYAKERKPRPARNPRTGEAVVTSRHRTALFRFSPAIKNDVNFPYESTTLNQTNKRR